MPCKHGRQRSRCKKCGGSSLCEHGRQRHRCNECCSSILCEHGRQRHRCKECGGSSLCAHGRRRSLCKECGGSSMCEHGRQRYKCKACRAAKFQHGETSLPAPTATLKRRRYTGTPLPVVRFESTFTAEKKLELGLCEHGNPEVPKKFGRKCKHCRKANSQQGEASTAEPTKRKPRVKAVRKKQQPRWQGTRLPIVTFEFYMMTKNAERAERQRVVASQCLSLELRDADATAVVTL